MINLADYGYHPENHPLDGLTPCRITAIHRERSIAICPHGEIGCQLSGSFQQRVLARADLPAVGDFALVRHNPQGDSLIERILPRTSQFSRLDSLGSHASRYQTLSFEQVVASNFDYVFIMSSLNKDFNLKRIARYLIEAYNSGATPVIVLTKADLCDSPADYLLRTEAEAPGVPVIALSSHTGGGMDQLASYVAPGKTLVFLGMSGVGKSSLLNALYGDEVMKVKAIREDDARGRHTTTHRELVMLPSGAMIIDTPGMRELGLWDAEAGLGEAFSDVEALIALCRFSDCGHGNEPGCAVRAALTDGRLSQRRWDTYVQQRKELAYAMDRTKYIRDRSEKFRQLSRWSRQTTNPKR